MSFYQSFAAFIATFVLAGAVASGHAQVGQPLIVNFSPKAYSSKEFTTSPQNFGLTQDGQGLIYVGNTNTVMVFDGQTWEEVAGCKNRRFFKLDTDRSGRVYTGGMGDLGEIKGDERGEPSFFSLKEMLPDSVRDFKRVTRVKALGDSVFFLANPYLFCWDGQQFQVWKNPEGFRRVFPTTQGVFVTFSSASALYQVEEEGFKTVCPLENLQGIALQQLFALRGGSNGTPRLALVSRRDGLFLWEGGNLKKMNPGLDSIVVNNATRFQDGRMVIATTSKGAYILSEEGEVEAVIDENTGLQQSEVIFPYIDRESGLWTCLASGVSRIEYSSPLSLIAKRNGLPAIPIAMGSWRGSVFVGTKEGGFWVKPGKIGQRKTIMEPLPLELEEIWGFVEMDKQFLLGTNRGVFAGSGGNELKQIGPHRRVISMLRSAIDPNRIYFSMVSNTIASIRWEVDHWVDEGELAEVPHSIYSLAESKDGRLWAAHNGLSCIDLKAPKPKVVTLDSTYGLQEEMAIIEVCNLNGKIHLGTELGIHCVDPLSLKVTLATSFGDDFADGSRLAYNLTETRSGDVWVTTNHQTGLLRKVGEAEYRYDSLPIIRAEISDVFSIYEDPEGIVWLGGTEALVRYNPEIPVNPQLSFKTLVRKVLANTDSVLFGGGFVDANGLPVEEQPQNYTPHLDHEHNDITFEFAAPFFGRTEALEYSYVLEGQDDLWSGWTSKTEKEYTNLAEGKFSFKVKARNIYGVTSDIGEYNFSIAAPWFRTLGAYFGYGLLAVLLVFGIVKFNSRRLVKANQKLEGVVADRTEEIQGQKDEIEGLLLNILPQEIADELIQFGEVKPSGFDQATVMFTDFKGFTMIAEQYSPEELVKEIHTCFSFFDSVVEKYGIEKIKTIGDAYMCAGGIPHASNSTPRDVVQAALEIRDFMRDRLNSKQAEGELGFQLRLGIHTGPVIAGVVGHKKFQFDIWGDTVNTASRMESSGEVDKVNISQATYELVKEDFACVYRGEIEAKNKGKISMYFAEGFRNEQ